MPELPEVETTRRGLEPALLGRRIVAVQIRQPKMRWPVPTDLAGKIGGKTIQKVNRRGKYLLLHMEDGTLIVHLGMSGSLRLAARLAPEKHDHVIISLDDGRHLILRDP
ncbi:MAG TPA: DNA-formamidopyrimidine glycosylase, partial [Methylothermaceae bacterium]|nr:DNA-formamidopyrimidine glycosylase [Methylothermaceae bacterium]